MYAKAAYYQYKRANLIFLLPSEYSKVLEIGCADGSFRYNLKYDCEYWGVEPVRKMAQVAAERMDKVLIGFYQSVVDKIPNDYFDLIICNDVIEHMPDSDVFLQSIKLKLANDGRIIGSVPNVRYIMNLYELIIKKDWKYKDAGILDKSHLRFFSKRSLLRAFNENGYEIVDVRGINPYKFQMNSFKSIVKFFLFQVTYLIFGKDIKFLQFGFHVRL
jgi:2-polyprenyl-3-methyl-5-hydroxy-6-metoxy-1,4-benzoquinol methylase